MEDEKNTEESQGEGGEGDVRCVSIQLANDQITLV